jgi:hypothetical protein
LAHGSGGWEAQAQGATSGEDLLLHHTMAEGMVRKKMEKHNKRPKSLLLQIHSNNNINSSLQCSTLSIVVVETRFPIHALWKNPLKP